MPYPGGRDYDVSGWVQTNRYNAKRLVVRWLDTSGDPYTLGYGGARWSDRVRVGDKLMVGNLKTGDIDAYQNTLPLPEKDWTAWSTNMLVKVWREDNKNEWAVANWYELAYIRYRLKKVLKDVSQGGLMSNATELGDVAETLYREWNMSPIPEGTVGVELDKPDDYHLTLGFKGLRQFAQQITRLQVHYTEVKEVPTKHGRSELMDVMRPKNPIVPGRPPFNDWMWEMAILETGMTLSSDDPDSVHLFNEYMRDKIDTEMLTKFVRPTMPSRRLRRLGRYKRKRGIAPTDKKPLVAASISIFGNLFWGTKHGFHREFVEDRGRKKGVMGVLNIIWVNSQRDLNHENEYFDFEFEEYYRIFATIINLIEKNASEGNTLNFYVTPSGWETENCNTGLVENRVIIPRGIDGDPPTRLTQGHNPFGEYWNMHVGVPNTSVKDLLTKSQKQTFLEEVRDSFSTGDPRCPVHHRNIVYDNGVGRCTGDGGHVPKMVTPTFGEHNVGYFVKAERDDEPSGLLTKLMNSHPVNVGAMPKEPIAMSILTGLEERLSHEKRGTTIIITPMPYIKRFIDGIPYIKDLDEWSDIIVIDLGSRNWNMLFRTEPDLLRKPKWGCTVCGKTKEYHIKDWISSSSAYPPTCHSKPMKPIGKPMINYIYVGADVENLPYYVLKAMKGKLADLPEMD